MAAMSSHEAYLLENKSWWQLELCSTQPGQLYVGVLGLHHYHHCTDKETCAKIDY